LLVHGRWFSPDTPLLPPLKLVAHDIVEILLEVAINTKNQNQNQIKYNIGYT
jgi:hypothetical protein